MVDILRLLEKTDFAGDRVTVGVYCIDSFVFRDGTQCPLHSFSAWTCTCCHSLCEFIESVLLCPEENFPDIFPPSGSQSASSSTQLPELWRKSFDKNIPSRTGCLQVSPLCRLFSCGTLLVLPYLLQEAPLLWPVRHWSIDIAMSSGVILLLCSCSRIW